jgi:hypothetical protein
MMETKKPSAAVFLSGTGGGAASIFMSRLKRKKVSFGYPTLLGKQYVDGFCAIGKSLFLYVNS